MSQTRPATIAVTGAGGWIGGRLCRVASARGFAVRPLGRQETRSDAACAEALAGSDALVHLAALVHRPRGAAPAQAYREVNEGLTARLAAAARAASVRRLVFASTAKVVGERTVRPARESDAPAPADDYARSKLAAERALIETGARGGPEVVIARPPLVYGPGVRANFLALLRLADSPWPLPLAGARAARSLVYLDNLVDALLFLCEAPAAAGRTFFVSDGEDLAVADLVERIRRGLGRPRRLFGVPHELLRAGARATALVGADLSPALARLFEPLQVDSGALRSLGWRPPVGVDDALEETLRWYRSR
jgi:UDP-glucose 4-epimerase